MPTLPAYDLGAIAERLHRSQPETLGEVDAHAAVAMTLRARAPNDDAEVLLIERALREGDPWSGHMAFPGGRRASTDATLLDTVVRETREEVSIDLARDATLITRLTDVSVRMLEEGIDMVVTPYVFVLHRDVVTRPNHEVAATFWTPLAPLARGEVRGTHRMTWRNHRHEMPCFTVQSRTVWGLTFQMFERLFDALHAPR